MPARAFLGLAAVACLLPVACVVSTHGGVGAPLDVPPVPKAVSTGAEPASSPDSSAVEATPLEKIGAKHILVSYRGALRAAPSVLRSREEAYARAQEALSKAKAGEPFEKLVQTYSDDLGSASRGGDLGTFTRQDMVAEFSEAAFKLDPGELSDVIESQFGFHVILRTE